MDELTLELNRAFAMSAAWDEAAEALSRARFADFDQAMDRFHQIHRGAGVPNKQPASDDE